MRKSNRFGFGGCFKCVSCGRKTRENGDCNSDLELCPECMEASELENGMSDNGETPEMLAQWQDAIDRCRAKGGNPDADKWW